MYLCIVDCVYSAYEMLICCYAVFWQDGDSEGDSGFVTPDSTTKEKVPRFIEGEDVLSHGKDGLFYLGVIVVVSALCSEM